MKLREPLGSSITKLSRLIPLAPKVWLATLPFSLSVLAMWPEPALPNMNLGSSPKLKVGPWLADQTFGERMVRNGFGRVDPIVSAERGRTGGWIVHVGAH